MTEQVRNPEAFEKAISACRWIVWQHDMSNRERKRIGFKRDLKPTKGVQLCIDALGVLDNPKQ